MILTYIEMFPMKYFNFFGFYTDSPLSLSPRPHTPVILYTFNYTYQDDRIFLIQSRFLLLSSSFDPTLTSFSRFSPVTLLTKPTLSLPLLRIYSDFVRGKNSPISDIPTNTYPKYLLSY